MPCRAHNRHPKPLSWTADPDKIIAAVKRGHQALDSIHQAWQNNYSAYLFFL